ncbi:MAG: STAS domain-containing protein, partial [Deltaproteobacteria bacterium]|nr:STAS domain-containing protein [Deltaproteobacteria bacterium]
MDIVRDENAGLCTLCFNGNLTVDSVVELKEALLGALETSDDLCINLEGATQVDLACLQVLCSAHMTAVGMDKQLQLMKPL